MNKKIIKIGVIGGMGPLASSSFVETFYTYYLKEETLKEHYHQPYVYLYSEPLLSQTTPVLSISQSETELVRKLKNNISHLMHQEIDYIIICCFTAHALISRLSPSYKNKIVSLVTHVLEYVLQQNTQYVMLSASSAREAKVLESHPLWLKASYQISFISDTLQKQLNELIKAVKNDQVNLTLLDNYLEFLNQFPKHKYILACAELHLLHKKLQTYSRKEINTVFDPFNSIIQRIWG